LLEAAAEWPAVKAAINLHLALGRPGHRTHSPMGSAKLVEARVQGGSPFLLRAGSFDPRPDEELATVAASAQSGAPVFVPPEWAQKLDEGSMQLLKKSTLREGEQVLPMALYRARLQCDESYAVVLSVAPTASPESQRAAHIGNRIRMMDSLSVSAGHVCPALEIHVFARSTFIMRPDFDDSLAGLLRRAREDGTTAEGRALMPYTQALQIFADILEGLSSLEKIGLVHFDLKPESILIKDGRAFIGDYGCMCLQHAGDEGFGCDDLRDEDRRLVGSAFRQAPDVSIGTPTGPSNHIWAAGLVLAEVVLGEMPVEMFFFGQQDASGDFQDTHPAKRQSSNIMALLDKDPFGREIIRGVVDDNFEIDVIGGFDELPAYLQDILLGLLEKNVEDRLSTTAALEKTKRALAEHGPGALPEAPLLRLPSVWFDRVPP